MLGKTVWFFGLPCSGKTTLAKKLVESFEKRGMRVHHLDGDVVRKKFTKDLGFSIDDRFENIRRMGYLAESLNKHGINVIASFVTPMRAYRYFLDKIFGKNIVFIECHASIERCMERDVKGMYEEALFGRIKDFTGLTSPYEMGPTYGKYHASHTEALSQSDCVIKIRNFLERCEVF